jgi:hypothetical protein
MNDDLIRAEIAEKLRRHQRFRDEALERLAAEPKPPRHIRRRVLLALAWVLVAAVIFGAAVAPRYISRAATPEPVPTGPAPITTGYIPTPAGPPNPAWPVCQPTTP